MNDDLHLVTPFPLSHSQWLWILLNEFPLQNLDDTSPRGPQAFAQEIHRRQNSGGETIWEVVWNGEPIGVIGYCPLSPDAAVFHGIAFARKHHGTGRPLEAVKMALEQIFMRGIETVIAAYFADNIPVHKFLKKLGAVEKHGEVHHAAREGRMEEVKLVSIHVDHFRALFGSGVRGDSTFEPQTVGGAD